VTRGLADTSVFIAQERERPLGEMPSELAVSVITIGELELGVLAAGDARTRARRADTLALAQAADPIPVGEAVMSAFARLVHDCRGAGLRPRVLDALIAATSIQHGLPLVTQDNDFSAIAAAHPQLAVILV
jgi:predicted nucleic acid-binding protein